MSAQIVDNTQRIESIGELARVGLENQYDIVRRELEAEAARLLTDATAIRFTLSDDDRPAREVPRPTFERHLTQFEIDARPEKRVKKLHKRIRCRLIAKSLLRVDSY